MSIDVANANQRAKELQIQAKQLRNAKNNLYQYRSMLQNSWQGVETEFYLKAILDVEKKLQGVSSELEKIGRAIVSTAEQIENEEKSVEEV